MTREDPRNARIAELERLLAGFSADLRRVTELRRFDRAELRQQRERFYIAVGALTKIAGFATHFCGRASEVAQDALNEIKGD
jgi:hypothetical protein